MLVIDNNVELCHLIQEYLLSLGQYHSVDIAFNGKEGLKQALREKPDIIILDLAMPYMDGLAVIEGIRRHSHMDNVKILVLTAFSKDEMIPRLIQQGVDQYLFKPFQFEDLRQRLAGLWSHQPTIPVDQPRDTQKEPVCSGAITKLLMDLGIPSHFKGFRYLQTAIDWAAQNGFSPGLLSHELYPALAGEHGVTAGAVEAAIRNAIVHAWEHGNQERIDSLYRSRERKIPTNSLFIAAAAAWIRSGMDDNH